MVGHEDSAKSSAQRVTRFGVQIAAAFATSALFACAPSPPTDDSLAHKGTELAGTVRFHDVEGGCWAIELDNAVTVQPLNLTPPFQQAGLKIKVQLEDVSGASSVCQVGELKNIVSIRPQ